MNRPVLYDRIKTDKWKKKPGEISILGNTEGDQKLSGKRTGFGQTLESNMHQRSNPQKGESFR